MKDIILFPHGGSGNHGCEAIVRSTIKVLKNPNKKHVYLFTMDKNQDAAVGLNSICTLNPYVKNIKKYSTEHIKAALKYHILRRREAFDIASFNGIFSKTDENTVAFSIGGDNYCYGAPEQLYFINRQIRKRGSKTVLWGCSVEPSAIDGKMAEDLGEYNLITARESISYTALKEINSNTILCPDPAFQLDEEKHNLPDGFVSGNTVGINISPMIRDREYAPGILLNNCRTLIRWILKETDMSLALIPHVCWPTNDDRMLLKQLFEDFSDNSRVISINECNCMRLKYILSQCRFVIAARTHASIAAYSSCVPTLVIGYSVKATGIARDIFGRDKDFVIPIEDILTDNSLLQRFKWIIDHEEDIKMHLSLFMPNYCQNVFCARQELKMRDLI